MLNVEFEWFDPQPKFDFHGIKTLLRQLFDTDALLVDLSAITDLVLAQPLLGSTVKVEGNETDPYAFLTVLNLKEHKVWNHMSRFRYLNLLKTCPGQTCDSRVADLSDRSGKIKPNINYHSGRYGFCNCQHRPCPYRKAHKCSGRGSAANVQHVAGRSRLGS